MGNVLSNSYRFGCNSTPSNVFHKQLSVETDFVDSPIRHEKFLIYNDGEEDITVDVDGSKDDSAWVQVGTVAVPAKTSKLLTVNYALGGGTADVYAYGRMQAYTASGESTGRVETIDASSQYRR